MGLIGDVIKSKTAKVTAGVTSGTLIGVLSYFNMLFDDFKDEVRRSILSSRSVVEMQCSAIGRHIEDELNALSQSVIEIKERQYDHIIKEVEK